ncbi:GNAT superfamily N-acetyltransferase [Kribbella aluminosa]|uniref:GNAT superfamily N-acetyltransferase n=1 Tax=Kribbella aluminosa TaxID=416017 RepID=A0ABS4UYX4_9ACTN|nr:GNAT family N-acetyltransferase [Kribbella aluminosa]MBP2356741.1 GNAT superfamily N-acetyltransferase [Kribbella aluminosa]
MHDEALTRWQRGWSAARGWNDAQRVDDVAVVRVGEPQRRVEYVATEPNATAAAHLALIDCNPPGTSWLKIATAEPERVVGELRPLEYVRTEWLMTISLPDQALHPVPAPYAVEVTGGPSLIDVRIYGYGELAAGGRMSILHTGAVADMIHTDPAHRRRGLARAVMTTLATTAVARHTTTAHLAASPEGRPLYNSLGWTTLTPLLVARTTPP